MATMTFLATFNGDATYQYSGGTSSFDTSGVTYASSTYFSSKQGVVVDSTDSIRSKSADHADFQAFEMVHPNAGSLAIRFKANTALSGANQWLVHIGRASINGYGDQITLRRNSTDRSVYFSTLMFLRRMVSSVSVSNVCIDILPSATMPTLVNTSMIFDRCFTVFFA